MTIPAIARSAQKFLADNSPSILTGLGVAGLVSTTVLAVRATPQAHMDILQADSELGRKITPVEKVRLTWKYYIPAGLSMVAAATCIIGAHSVHTRRNAAIMSVYSLSETAFKEYKDKVIEKFGESKEQEVRDEVNIDRVKNNPPSDEVHIYKADPDGQFLCYDSVSGRYFKSSPEKILQAQNIINAKCINEMYASQNDFYRLVGLPINGLGEEVGWSTDNLLDIQFTSTLTENNTPAMVLDYRRQPIHGYYKFM